ncbi:sugar ABC transporter substrate-binding protein [Clostridium polyendosporum]|uniref:Sugar ABC transporter substrate-binding protein n=1 Tax=Clostridium polyendosporum TaxID=69208 RepID=A0A919RZ95_9CLOT|nr:sugar ABC transporter substrate-binding protein [Clostridium polyendosporum]GIM29285.1 sugar ABC transporter substrate-binding protein [Clostridium polyendosporum]
MKKFLSMTLITVMTMCLFTGCVQKTNNTLKISKKIRIGVCIANINDKFLSYMLNEMKNYSKSLNDVEVVFVDSKGDSNIQLAQVENFISEGADAIIVNPVDTNSSKPITDKAKAAKVPIISLNEPFQIQNDAASYIDSDSKQSGILEMEYLAKKMNFKGNVVIIMGRMDNEAQRLRTEAYHEVIAKYPDMKIVAMQPADWNRARGMALMQNWLESGKQIDVVVANNDEMAIGALKAIEAAGKLGKITVGGIDTTPDALDYLKSGRLAVTVFQDGAGQAKCAIETAVKVAKGESVEKRVIWQNELVTPEDADKYIDKWGKWKAN